MTLTLSSLGNDYQPLVTTQDYSPKTKIEGVKVVDLTLFHDDGGSFAELIRCDERGHLELLPDFKVEQVSYSEVQPGAIKAFHLHYNQEDLWFVPPTDRLLVGLVDLRQDSASYNVRMRLVAGAGRAQLILIPRGVAHGCANLGTQAARIIYFLNQKFSATNPDEQRLPWDSQGAEFWEVTRG